MEIEKTFKHFEKYNKYIISQEGDDLNTRIHQHILLETEELRDDIAKHIRHLYPDAIGNKGIYIRPSRDKMQLAKYTLKEGNYLYKGFSEKFINEKFKCSKAKTDLKKDITALEDKLILREIHIEKFIKEFIELKVKYDQPLYVNHIRAYCLKMAVKSGAYTSDQLAQNVMEGFGK